MEKFDFNDALYLDIINLANDGIYFVDTDRRITFWNKGAEKISGFSAEEMINRRCQDNILNHINGDGENLCKGSCPLAKTLEDGKDRQAPVFLHHKDGQRVPVHVRIIPIQKDNKIIGAVELFNDESAPHAYSFEDSADLKDLAFRDQLTGLPNRRLAEYYIDGKINGYANLEVPFWLAILDVDSFKQINDLYGHNAGDKILKAAAKTMMNVIGPSDFAGRWGGDEFVLIFYGYDKAGVTAICETLRKVIETATVNHNGIELKSTVSLGVAEYLYKDTRESLIEKADKQLYLSKQGGKNKTTVK